MAGRKETLLQARLTGVGWLGVFGGFPSLLLY